METLTNAAAAPLAVVERDGFIESRHAGAALVVDADGATRRALGAVEALVLPRSTLKPFQSVTALMAGARLSSEQVAVATGSHTGSARHVGVVAGILDAAGVDSAALRCPPAWPRDPEARRAAMARGREARTPLAMECSGKHAAMLAACRSRGWSLEDYTDASHPLQEAVRETVERLASEKIAQAATDGCGVPSYALSLGGLVTAFRKLSTASPDSPFAFYASAASVAAAMRAHPWALAGEGRPDTVVAEELTVTVKSGAEGTLLAAAPNGTVVGVKVLDGAGRAPMIVALALLAEASAVPARAAAELVERLGPLRGGGRVVGRVRAAFED